jgi:hypothetical protein
MTETQTTHPKAVPGRRVTFVYNRGRTRIEPRLGGGE